MRKILFLILPLAIIGFSGCKKEAPKLRFKFVFDSSLPRLNNFGQPATIPAGNAAQTPNFHLLGAHYIELAPGALTALGSGTVLYRGDETTAGGANALIFERETLVGNNEEFFSIPLSDVTPGTYEWLRVSLAYQNYDITYRWSGVPGVDLSGTVASFIGFNTYITNFKVKDSTLTVNANKKQGFWAFETSYAGYGTVISDQAPANATTVPNPLHLTSPIPAGSCVVTGSFNAGSTPLTISGNETSDITVIVKVSTNQSFEWQDNTADGKYEPLGSPADVVVDMGVRGIYPEVE